MPQDLIDDPTTYPAHVQAPVSGDARNTGSIVPGFQGLANRTAALKARIDAVAPGSGGSPGAVRALFHVADLTALANLSGMADKSIALVDGYGLFQFIAGDTNSDDLFYEEATDSSGSWWLMAIGAVGRAGGLAVLDSVARVAAANVRNGIISSTSAKVGTVGTTIATTSSTSYVDITGVSLAVASANVGDKLVVNGAITISSATTGGQCALAVTDTTPTTTLIQEAPFIAGSYGMLHFTGVFTVLAAGTQTVKLRYLSTGGSGTQTAIGQAAISALLIRP